MSSVTTASATSNGLDLSFDADRIDAIAAAMDLRTPNRDAIEKVAKALDGAAPEQVFVVDVATGVGKTYAAAGLIEYLYGGGVRNIVIVTPGSAVQAKTVGNFTPGNRKFVKGMTSNPAVITIDDVDRGVVATDLDNEDRLKIFVVTVQSLLKPNTEASRRAYNAHESVGIGLYQYLQGRDDVVVIADEHHVYFSTSAKKFTAALHELHPLATVGVTATPDPQTPVGQVVYTYPLADAIADGYVKIPVLVARSDGASDLRTQLADGIALLDRKRDAVTAYAKRTKKQPVEPVMLVVAQTIQDATEIAGILAEPTMLGSADAVLTVTSDQPDATLAKVEELDAPGNPYRAVVSVNMLREGWDCKAVYVIAAVRAMESELLTEQILGRGLRLPFGARTGVQMLDTVEVLSHHKFRDLLKSAGVLLRQTLGERADGAGLVVDPTAGVRTDPLEAGSAEALAAAEGADGQLVLTVPVGPKADPNQPSLFGDSPVDDEDDPAAQRYGTGLVISDLTERLADGDAAVAAVSQTLVPHVPAGVHIPLFLPRVSSRWVRDPFSLASVDLISVKALGQVFADDQGVTLLRKALDVERDDRGVHLAITDAEEAISASLPMYGASSITTDLVTRLLATDGIEASLAEVDAATAVAQAFLDGAGVSDDTPWRREHGQAATAKLVSWLADRRTASPVREVREVVQVEWPDPVERDGGQPPADRHLITHSNQFTRGYPYAGWTRSIYDVVTFHAYSTEFRLAELFEATAGVRAWVRIDTLVPLNIPWMDGALTRIYIPDFIVIDNDGVFWVVEGKSDKDAHDTKVLAKRDAAKAWIATVNADPGVQARWAYLFVTEEQVKFANSWTALRTLGWSVS